MISNGSFHQLLLGLCNIACFFWLLVELTLCKLFYQSGYAAALVGRMLDRVASSLQKHFDDARKLLLLLSETISGVLTTSSIQLPLLSVTFVSLLFFQRQHGSQNQQPPSHHHHLDKWLPCWNGNTPEVMSQWNFSPLSFGWLRQGRGYLALTWRPTETMSCLTLSGGPLPQGLQTSFSAYFHSEILAFLCNPSSSLRKTVIYC